MRVGMLLFLTCCIATLIVISNETTHENVQLSAAALTQNTQASIVVTTSDFFRSHRPRAMNSGRINGTVIKF